MAGLDFQDTRGFFKGRSSCGGLLIAAGILMTIILAISKWEEFKTPLLVICGIIAFPLVIGLLSYIFSKFK